MLDKRLFGFGVVKGIPGIYYLVKKLGLYGGACKKADWPRNPRKNTKKIRSKNLFLPRKHTEIHGRKDENKILMATDPSRRVHTCGQLVLTGILAQIVRLSFRK